MAFCFLVSIKTPLMHAHMLSSNYSTTVITVGHVNNYDDNTYNNYSAVLY